MFNKSMLRIPLTLGFCLSFDDVGKYVRAEQADRQTRCDFFQALMSFFRGMIPLILLEYPLLET